MSRKGAVLTRQEPVHHPDTDAVASPRVVEQGQPWRLIDLVLTFVADSLPGTYLGCGRHHRTLLPSAGR